MLSKLLSAAEEASRSGGLHQLDYPFWPSEETTSDDMLISRGGTCARTLLLSTRMAASSLSSHLNAPASSSRRIHGLKPFFPQLLSYSPFLSRPSLFSSLASVDSNKLHKKSNHPVAALLEIGGVKIAKDGTFLFVFSIYLRQFLKKKRERSLFCSFLDLFGFFWLMGQMLSGKAIPQTMCQTVYFRRSVCNYIEGTTIRLEYWRMPSMSISTPVIPPSSSNLITFVPLFPCSRYICCSLYRFFWPLNV